MPVRTGEYRAAGGEAVTDEEGDSDISRKDLAVALVDELEAPQEIHSHPGTGY